MNSNINILITVYLEYIVPMVGYINVILLINSSNKIII